MLMKLSEVKTFRDLCTSFFVLDFDPEDKPKRARTESGRYKGDDPDTEDVNEAWE